MLRSRFECFPQRPCCEGTLSVRGVFEVAFEIFSPPSVSPLKDSVAALAAHMRGRGFLSSTSQRNVSTLCELRWLASVRQ